jgi:hypothetical protein
MILLSQQGFAAAQIAGLLGDDPRPCAAGSTARMMVEAPAPPA